MQAQRYDGERIQERALRIIFLEYGYYRALHGCELKMLQKRRDNLCVLVVNQIDVRAITQIIYNYPCRTERFKDSPLIYAIHKYNDSLKS